MRDYCTESLGHELGQLLNQQRQLLSWDPFHINTLAIAPFDQYHYWSKYLNNSTQHVCSVKAEYCIDFNIIQNQITKLIYLYNK